MAAFTLDDVLDGHVNVEQGEPAGSHMATYLLPVGLVYQEFGDHDGEASTAARWHDVATSGQTARIDMARLADGTARLTGEAKAPQKAFSLSPDIFVPAENNAEDVEYTVEIPVGQIWQKNVDGVWTDMTDVQVVTGYWMPVCGATRRTALF